jgi:hypothetical protein
LADMRRSGRYMPVPTIPTFALLICGTPFFFG